MNVAGLFYLESSKPLMLEQSVKTCEMGMQNVQLVPAYNLQNEKLEIHKAGKDTNTKKKFPKNLEAYYS